MMFRRIVLFALASFALMNVAMAQAPPPTGSKFWPLNNHCDYRTYAITGYYSPSTMAVDVYTRKYIVGGDVRHTFIPVQGAQIPTSANVYSPAGTAPPANWYGHSDNLAQSIWTADGVTGWVGESGTFGAAWAPGLTVLLPPEPEAPLGATQYLTPITGTTAVTAYDIHGNVRTETVAWKFRNMGLGTGPNGTWWPSPFPNDLRTALEERPDTNKQTPDYDIVYNYLFSANPDPAKSGPVDVWWGIRRADNTVTDGWEWSAISCDGGP